MLGNDFAVFILTHGRSHRQYSYELLKKINYTGKILFIVDSGDESRFDLIKRYGRENVVVFNKSDYSVDIMDNSGDLSTPIYAEKFMYEYARENGYSYFARMDDDVRDFRYKVEVDGVLKDDGIKSGDKIFEIMVDFMRGADMALFGPSRAGFYFGGSKNDAYMRGTDFNVSQLILCSTKHEVRFRGKTYSDLLANLDVSTLGVPAFRTMYLCVRSPDEGSNEGGVKKSYDKDPSRYNSNFYAVMAHPSAVKIRKRKRGDFGHTIIKENIFPKIISGRYKRER